MHSYTTHARGTRYLYGVFVGSRWAMVTTMHDALTLYGGHKPVGIPREIRRMRSAPYTGERGASSFDAPTFRVLSDSVRSGR